ncbi:MAG: hypothetical protein GZ086_02395 [Gelidibacter sp.]|nr:hypothetical protein [Gelidibacter sp.]
MKKFIKHSVLFFVIFFIAEKSAYFISNASEREYDKRLEYVINGKMNKDLIILGSSIGASNILAGQIENETGLTAYNLSYPGSNVLFHEFILKSLLKFNNSPKTIILTIDNPSEFIEEKTLKYRSDRLYPLAKYNYINNELINQNEKNFMSKLFCLARLNTSVFKFDKIKTPIENPIDSSGSMPFIKKTSTIEMEFLEEVKGYTIKFELKEKLRAFKSIQKLCADNNIQLIFVFSPNYQKFNAAFEKRFQQLMLDENKIMVYDTLNPIYKNKDFYYDVSHLMKNGASIFTAEISTFIKTN